MEKPDYARIEELEIELGFIEPPVTVVASLMGTTYQRFIDTCTNNPQWWLTDEMKDLYK